jgi:hypothetical protein
LPTRLTWWSVNWGRPVNSGTDRPLFLTGRCLEEAGPGTILRLTSSTVNKSWQNGMAIFSAAPGTVTLGDNRSKFRFLIPQAKTDSMVACSQLALTTSSTKDDDNRYASRWNTLCNWSNSITARTEGWRRRRRKSGAGEGRRL